MGYIAKEAVEFCYEYLFNARTIGISRGVEEGIESRSGFKVIPTDYKTLCEAHYYVLQNTTVVDPYTYEHLTFIELFTRRKPRIRNGCKQSTREVLAVGLKGKLKWN